jgi:hypothetical protein
LNPEHLNQGRSNQTEGESVKSAFETLGYYAAAGVDSSDAQVQTMGREERLGRTAGCTWTWLTPRVR